MSKTLEFYFDFGSPTAYLAHKRLGQLAAQYPLDVIYKPMLLGGVFKAIGSASPVAIPAKGLYMMQHDLPRFARRYNVELKPSRSGMGFRESGKHLLRRPDWRRVRAIRHCVP